MTNFTGLNCVSPDKKSPGKQASGLAFLLLLVYLGVHAERVCLSRTQSQCRRDRGHPGIDRDPSGDEPVAAFLQAVRGLELGATQWPAAGHARSQPDAGVAPRGPYSIAGPTIPPAQ